MRSFIRLPFRAVRKVPDFVNHIRIGPMYSTRAPQGARPADMRLASAATDATAAMDPIKSPDVTIVLLVSTTGDNTGI